MDKLNYFRIKEKLPKEVNLLAVSKGFDSEIIKDFYNIGQFDFGESKFQEANIKQTYLKELDSIKWHYIGRIQTNKIRKIVQNFDYIHSVDSFEKLLKISKTAIEHQRYPDVMIQVKISDDPQKGGISADELIQNWSQISQIRGLQIIGLMTINPKGLSSKDNFKLFKKCRSLVDTLKLQHCSMGMSNDWEEAVEAGSTWIRLGSAIFGKRLV